MSRSASNPRFLLTAVMLATGTLSVRVQGQSGYTIDDVLSPGFPYSLVAAQDVDRIAWIEYERGMRNVYTAAPPNYEPARLTSFLEDDGIDLQTVQISDDGEILTDV